MGKSTFGWTPPVMDLPGGSYRLRRLSTRHLQGLIELVRAFQRETMLNLRIDIPELDTMDKEKLGEQVVDLAFHTPERFFEWARQTLEPVGDAPPLEKENYDDGDIIPIWFWTEYAQILLGHEDADRFFAGLFRLMGKDGAIRRMLRQYRGGSGESKAEPDGPTTSS